MAAAPPNGGDNGLSTSEYVRRHRVAAGMTVQDLAAGAGVDPVWLAAFEAGERTDELSYELLLALVRATQPPRPSWWDAGHEHDLHLGPEGRAMRRPGTEEYWQRIDAVRVSNRSQRSG